jgi:polyphosphate kinase 2 (PPK2 family)
MDGLVTEAEWERGYGEIRQFEQALTDDGYLLIKIFLHISKDEQRKRLQRLLSDPVTVWRVTPEDWVNHHRYDAWLDLYNEMLRRTHTEHAPWTLVPAMDARTTRLMVYRTLARALESRLDAP